MSHPIYSSGRFFYILSSLPYGSKEQIILRTRKDWRQTDTLQGSQCSSKGFSPAFHLLMVRKEQWKNKGTTTTKGTTAPLGNTLVSSSVTIVSRNKERTVSPERIWQISRTIPAVKCLQHFLAYSLNSPILCHRIYTIFVQDLFSIQPFKADVILYASK